MMQNPFVRLFKAAGYSLQGLWAALRYEPAFLMECLVCLILIPTAIIMALPLLSKLLMIASLLAVLAVELINSSIETVVDRISLDLDPLSKRAKDISSAASFVTVMNAIMIWGAILYFR